LVKFSDQLIRTLDAKARLSQAARVGVAANARLSLPDVFMT
jgi:hypothetical protein